MSVLGSRPLPLADTPAIVLAVPDEAHELAEARAIFREYAASLKVDLCFQNFDAELASLPGDYAEPRGTLLLALVEAPATAAPSAPALVRPDGRTLQVAGCCALRPLDTVDYANAAEMKRLYVRPGFRGLGLGRQLVEAVLDAARGAGYACVLLDTLDDMESARALYEDLGFVEVPPYYHNPIAGSHYLKVEL
ncbi:MAG: GNAT family N-acetyltransferase [Variovorax paradoxus]|uniref:GNAT family N-acetyltransferase n=1 Tax=Variovorax paradoxus TaxID=34073 RepID=A0A2W5PJB3_VARPD|nr:MAG: GNAT family N-acetyltransferase [Variovorax paradoxus]